MTIEDTSSKNAIVTGGYAVGATISITFPFEEPDTVCVETDELGELVYNTDYEIVETNVVLKKAIGASDKVQVYRKTPMSQERDIPQNAKFNSVSIEKALDKLTMQNQEQETTLSRCLKVPTFSDTTPEEMVEKVELVADNMDAVKTVYTNIEDVNTVSDNISRVKKVSGSISDVNTVATKIADVINVSANISYVATVSANISSVKTVAEDIIAVKNTSDNITEIKTVNENITTIQLLADKISNVNTVAGSINNVNSVGINIEAVKSVNANEANINTVATDILNVHEVGTHINDVVTVKNGLGSVEVVANNIADVQAVETIQESITTVAQNKDTVVSVGNNIATITAVNANKNNINAVAGNEANINAVNANKNNINTVSGLSAKISAVVDNETNINIVAGAIDKVNAVGNNIANVNAVASNETNINAAVANETNINTVATNLASIVPVAGSIANVNTVGENIANINAAVTNETNINTVATSISDISSVADAVEDVSLCAENIEDIKSAPSYAEQAKDSAKQSIYRDLFQCNSLNLNAEKPKTYFDHIEDLKHSTFDKSKFTVIGSPTITDDGIASGFSGSDFLKIENLGIDTYNITFTITFIVPTLGTECELFRLIPTTNSIRCIIGASKRFSLYHNVSPYSITSAILIPDSWVGDAVNATIKLTSNGNKVILNNISKNTQLSSTSTNIQQLIFNSVNIGFGASTFAFTTVDLKQFSITVDGVEVFSGNKTGIEVIKPDNYTVVGTPTISADGVASGFSTTSFIGLTALDFSKPWVFEASETVSDSMAGAYGGVNGFNVRPQTQTSFYFILRSLNSGNLLGSFNALNKEKVYYRVSWDGSVYKLEMKADDDQTYTTVKTFASTEALSGNAVNLGYNTDSAFASNGSYDLSDVKLYSNGELIYQPCLKIPYTESKTGSKIVDAVYRDRVQDVYSQGFDKYYYTLDEATKSVDELTGFNQTLSISKTDNSTVTKFADGTVEICGRVTAEGTINLPVTLKDTNYFCTLPTTEKTTTSFTTTQTGDYILKGELA